MKTLFCTILSIMFLNSISAQEVTQKELVMSLGDQNGFVVELPGADKKMAEKTWENYTKKYGKFKRNKKADEFFCEECDISLITSPTLQVTMKIEERKDLTLLTAWFDNGTNFIGSDTDATAAAAIEKFMYDYGIETRKNVVKEELEDEEDNLKDLEKDLEKLEKTNKGLHDDIEKYKRKIAEAESDIEKNLNEQDSKQVEIKTQSNVVGQVTEKLNSIGKN